MSEILIVDDEAPIRELLSRWLKAEGLALREAADADGALGLLAAHEIAVALCDKSMPGRDGLWLVERIREQHPAVAVILATGDDAIPPRVSLQSGVVGYLVKPFKRELVLAAVQDAMAWHRVATRQPRPPAGENPVDTWLKGRAGRPSPPTDEP